MNLKVKLEDGAPLPRHAKADDAGMDLTTRHSLMIFPGETVMAHTGVHVEIPPGYYGAIVPRSGIASKRLLAPINSPGTIDAGYRGEIIVPLHNFASPALLHAHYFDREHADWSLVSNPDAIQRVKAGERIAQLIILPYERCSCIEVDELSETDRGSGGFGSTGDA